MFATLKSFADYMVFNDLLSDINRVEYEVLIHEVQEGGSFTSMVDRVWAEMAYRQNLFDRSDVEEWVRLMITIRESHIDLTTRQGIKDDDEHSDAFSALIQVAEMAQKPTIRTRTGAKRKASSLPAPQLKRQSEDEIEQTEPEPEIVSRRVAPRLRSSAPPEISSRVLRNRR